MPNAAPLTALAFDFGLRRIGVAIGQTLTQTAQPLPRLLAQAGVPPWQQIKAIIQEWQPQALVVGLPINMDGTEQPLTLLVRDFIKELEKRFNLPVYSMDERLSSVAARERLYASGGYRALQKNSIDSVAAQLILESWLQNQ